MEDLLFYRYAENGKDYRLIDKQAGKSVVSGDVTLDESSVTRYRCDTAADHYQFLEESQQNENEEPIVLEVRGNELNLEVDALDPPFPDPPASKKFSNTTRRSQISTQVRSSNPKLHRDKLKI